MQQRDAEFQNLTESRGLRRKFTERKQKEAKTPKGINVASPYLLKICISEVDELVPLHEETDTTFIEHRHLVKPLLAQSFLHINIGRQGETEA